MCERILLHHPVHYQSIEVISTCDGDGVLVGMMVRSGSYNDGDCHGGSSNSVSDGGSGKSTGIE